MAHAAGLGLEVPDGARRSEIIAAVDELHARGGVQGRDRWHPLVRDWYDSLAQSGQAVFYEPSDWLTAQLLAEAMSRELNPQPVVVGRGEFAYVEMVSLPPKGASLAAWFKAMSSLLVTEGDRRRMQLELQRDPEPDADAPAAEVTDLRTWREALGG